MRRLLPLLALLFLAAPSCERAKELLQKGKKASADATAKASGDVTEIDAASYDAFTKTPGQLVVVEFGAEWCGVCKQMAPVVAQVSGEFPGKVMVGQLDVDHATASARSENVSAIPEFRLYRDGKMVEQIIGGVDAGRLREVFRKHTDGLTAAAQAAPVAGAPAIAPMKKDWMPPGIQKR
jgi:thioredoxin 1